MMAGIANLCMRNRPGFADYPDGCSSGGVPSFTVGCRILYTGVTRVSSPALAKMATGLVPPPTALNIQGRWSGHWQHISSHPKPWQPK